jgi:hypothetical protein
MTSMNVVTIINAAQAQAMPVVIRTVAQPDQRRFTFFMAE